MQHTDLQTEPREERTEAGFRALDPHPTPGNRRATTRFAVELDMSISTDHNFYAGFVENMSVGGVFVATHQLKQIGSVVDIDIYLPESNTTVRGKGEVRWIRDYNESSNVPPGMGIRFAELEPGGQEAIDEFLGRRDPMFFDED
jgi:uncharacterized protein (TIGR02266 family)